MDFSQERKTYTNHLPNICGLHFKTYLNEGSTGHLWTKLIPKIALPTYKVFQKRGGGSTVIGIPLQTPKRDTERITLFFLRKVGFFSLTIEELADSHTQSSVCLN